METIEELNVPILRNCVVYNGYIHSKIKKVFKVLQSLMRENVPQAFCGDYATPKSRNVIKNWWKARLNFDSDYVRNSNNLRLFLDLNVYLDYVQEWHIQENMQYNMKKHTLFGEGLFLIWRSTKKGGLLKKSQRVFFHISLQSKKGRKDYLTTKKKKVGLLFWMNWFICTKKMKKKK